MKLTGISNQGIHRIARVLGQENPDDNKGVITQIEEPEVTSQETVPEETEEPEEVVTEEPQEQKLEPKLIKGAATAKKILEKAGFKVWSGAGGQQFTHDRKPIVNTNMCPRGELGVQKIWFGVEVRAGLGYSWNISDKNREEAEILTAEAREVFDNAGYTTRDAYSKSKLSFWVMGKY